MRGSWSRGAGAPAVPVALGLSGGILLGAWLPALTAPAPLALLAFLAALGAVAGSPRRRPVYLILPVLAMGLALGRWRVRLPAARDAASARLLGEDRLVEVVGTLDGPWTSRGSLHVTTIAVIRAVAGGHEVRFERPLSLVVSGRVDPRGSADRGDVVRVRAPISLPQTRALPRTPFSLPPTPSLRLKSAQQLERLAGPGGLLGPVHLLRRSIRERFHAVGEGPAEEDPYGGDGAAPGPPPRQSSGASDREGPSPAAALALAFLLGETADLSPSLVAAFRDGGVAHVLSVSGLHVTLIAAVLARLLGPWNVSFRTRDPALLVLVLFYAVLAGGRAPVMRAALMVGLYLVARLAGRPTSPANVLGLSAALLLLVSPGDLFDTGFQLSFAAMAGLSAFGVPLARWLSDRGAPALLADSAGATLGAELLVLPIQVMSFNTVPFVSLVSNLLVVPLAGLFLTLSAGLTPLVLLGLHAALTPLDVLASTMVWTLDALDRLAAVRFVPTPSFAAAAAAFLLLLGAACSAAGRARRAQLSLGVLVCAAITLWPAASAREGEAVLQAIDVGQGDSWALLTERGRILVDGGGSIDPAYAFGRSRLLPRLADRGLVSFDAVLLTHPHPDHGRGLVGVLELLPVGELVVPAGVAANDVLDEVLSAAARRGIPVRRARAGDKLEVAGLELQVLHPGEHTYPRSRENNGSLVVSVGLGSRRALLTGDVEGLAESDLLERGGLRADVLKVAHHGSRTSTSPAFLAAVYPRIGLIGVGQRNTFGHPSPAVLTRLKAASVRVFRTDLDGEVAIASAGGRLFPRFAPLPSEGTW